MVNGNDELSGWILDLDLAAPDGLDLFNSENQHFYGGIVWSIIAKAALAMYAYDTLSLPHDSSQCTEIQVSQIHGDAWFHTIS